jgi:hypothetical protein
MSTRRKPLEGQLPLPFMADKRRTAKRPKLAIVRADDQPTEAEPKPVTKRRLKAG